MMWLLFYYYPNGYAHVNKAYKQIRIPRNRLTGGIKQLIHTCALQNKSIETALHSKINLFNSNFAQQ